MMCKNTFRFATCVVTVGLGVGLILSGCGDSGSTTPNPLGGSSTPRPPSPEPPTPEPPTPEPPTPEPYKVTFQYNSLAKNLGRTEVAADIVSVKYAFYGKTDNKKFTIAPTKAHEFKHETSAQEQDITIDATEVEELNENIYAVTAAYYAENDKLVAVGYDPIDWQGQKAVTITKPDLYTINEDDLSLTSYDPTTGKNKRVFKPNEKVGLSCKVELKGETPKIYDLTPFATFNKLTDKDNAKVTVLEVAQDGANGQFIAAANGTVDSKASIATIGATVPSVADGDIYVTEQTIEDIELSPVNDKIEVLNSSFFILYIAKKDAQGNDIPNAALGQETATLDLKYPPASPYLVVGVDQVPMQVKAIYTGENQPEKGPQPEDVYISADQVKFNYERTTTLGQVGDLKVEDDGTVIVTSAFADDHPDQYMIKASYGDFTDESQVTIYYTESELCFAKEIDGKLEYVPESNPHESLYWNMRVVGRFRAIENSKTTNTSVPFFIDESLVGKNEYPEAIASPAVVQYSETFERAGDGSNKYLLNLLTSPKTHELKVGDFKVDLPKFVPLQITSAY